MISLHVVMGTHNVLKYAYCWLFITAAVHAVNLTWILDQPEDDGVNVTVYLQWNGTNPSFSYDVMIDVPDFQPVSHHVTSHHVNMTTEIRLKVLYNTLYNVSIMAKYICEQSMALIVGLYHCELTIPLAVMPVYQTCMHAGSTEFCIFQGRGLKRALLR